MMEAYSEAEVLPEPPTIAAVTRAGPTSSFDDTPEFGDDELFDDDDGGLGEDTITLDVDAEAGGAPDDDDDGDDDDGFGGNRRGPPTTKRPGMMDNLRLPLPYEPSDDEPYDPSDDEQGQLIVDEDYSLPLSSASVQRCTPCCDLVGRQVRICGPCGPRDYQRKRFPYICLVGPDWPCLVYTYGLITVPSFLFLFKVAWNVHSVVFVLGCLSYITLICSLSCAACSDPGIIPKQLPLTDEELGANEDEDPTHRVGPLCVHCNVYRPEGTIHCYDCNCCVLEVRSGRAKCNGGVKGGSETMGRGMSSQRGW